MNEENLKNYYNKFNEEKRLNSRHGKIEFQTTIKYIEKYLKNKKDVKVLDLGAGSGRYSDYLANQGYDVTAVELVKHNVKMIEEKNKNIKIFEGNAIKLDFLKEKYDLILIFGPLYHLIKEEDKLKVLENAKNLLNKDGIIMISYIMNDYAIIRHGFMEQAILNEINKIDEDFKIHQEETDLYSYMKLEDIDRLNKLSNLKRVKIIAQTGLSNHLRLYINKLNDKEFELYLKYHLSVCEKKEYLGTSSHILDILKSE